MLDSSVEAEGTHVCMVYVIHCIVIYEANCARLNVDGGVVYEQSHPPPPSLTISSLIRPPYGENHSVETDEHIRYYSRTFEEKQTLLTQK